MVFKLAVKSVVTRKSSYVIILFITLAITLFCVANAVFDSTEQGVQSSYVSTFTGDLMIRADSDSQISLFGDDTPVTGEMTKLGRIIPYKEIKATIEALPEYKACVSQLTGAGSCNGKALYLFGVEGEKYLEAMTSLRIVEGEPFKDGERGLMLYKPLADSMNVKIGSKLSFAIKDGPRVRARSAVVKAFYETDTPNAIFENYVLADPETVRSLMNLDNAMDYDEEEIEEDKTNLLSYEFDIDSLFDDAFDVDAVWEDVVVEEAPAAVQIQTETVAEAVQTAESTSWEYLIVRLNDPSKATAVINRLNRLFKEKGWPVNATDWRHAAGSTALYLYWMRIIFNVGIIIILAAGFIIISNTLVINILDRTREIGTLRAVGAGKGFISLQCMLETFMMTLTSGVLGTGLGVLASRMITKANIVFHNSFLIQLFGGEALKVEVTAGNIGSLFLLAIGLGFLGWIYPVITALKVTPVKAMAGAK